LKTYAEIRAAHAEAMTREHLCSMRAAAMNFREAVAPDSFHRSLVDQGEAGVFALQGAIQYRYMARNLGRWAPERAHADLQASWEGGGDE
jgi:hypothetical protein